MTAVAKVVQFVPSRVSGWRIPLGALINTGDRSTSLFVEAEFLPGASCLPDPRLGVVLRTILDILRRAPTVGWTLPASVGFHAEVDPRSHPIPTKSLDDAVQWVRTKLLPSRKKQDPVESERGPQRAGYGRVFFELYEVSKWVRLNFRWTDLRKKTLSDSAEDQLRLLTSQTLWVLGGDSVLLIEPLSPSRPNIREDAKTVFSTFAKYQSLAPRLSEAIERRTERLSLLLAGGDQDTRREVLNQLGAVSRTFDTENDDQKNEIISMIRSEGIEGEKSVNS